VRVCRLVRAASAQVPDAEFAVFDLGACQLPVFDEAVSPWSNPARQPAANVQCGLDDRASADRCLFVVPEYNHAVPAVKNSLDFPGHEADGKPAAILCDSGTDHGENIAAHELRLCLSTLGMLPRPSSLPLAHDDEILGPDGADFARKTAHFMPWSRRELARYAAAPSPLRERPNG
jgi:NAD(P)H-dependent FMN reductase